MKFEPSSPKQVAAHETAVFESTLVFVLAHIAEANQRVVKQLSGGRMGSDIAAARVELQAAANKLKELQP
jgi:hypothetical protein